MARTTTDILNGIKVRMLLPDGELTYSDQEILDLATAEEISYVAPKIQQVRQSYFTATSIIPKNGKRKFRIPYRSIGGALKEVKEIDTTNPDNPVRRNLPLYSLDEINGRESEFTTGVYFDGAHINLVGDSISSGTYDMIEMTIYIRPSRLVPVSEAAQIVAINGNTVTMSNLPSTMTSGVKIDFIKNGGLNDIVEFDIAIQSIDTQNQSITFSTSVNEDIESQDWIAIAGNSPVANIPEDFYPLLEQRTTVKLLEGLGDLQKAGLAQQKAQELETYLLATIVPRIESEEPICKNNIWWSNY